MLPWTKLIHYHLIWQAFCDSTGDLRIKTANHTMRSLVESHAFLRRIYHFPQWRSDFIMDLDNESRTEIHPLLEKLKPICIYGTYHKTEKWHQIQPDEQIGGAVRVTRKTKLEMDLKDGEQVLVCAQRISGGYEASMIISQQMYDSMHYLSGEWEKISGVSSFLATDQKTQEAIRWLMSSNDKARSMLWFLSYVAGFCAEGKDCSSDADLEAVLAQFNLIIAPNQGCVSLPLDEVLCIIDLMGIRVDLSSGSNWSDYFMRFLIVFGIVKKISSGNWKSIAKTLVDRVPCIYVEVVSSYLPHLCDENEYNSIVRDMLGLSSPQTYAISNAEDFLFEALAVSPFENEFVEKACDVLFAHSIAECHVTAMDRILVGPNGQKISEYIFEKVKEGLSAGKAQYHFTAAAVRNAQDYQNGLHPFKTAVEQAMQPTPEDFLIGVSRISLLLWTSIGNNRVELKKEYLTDEVVDTLLDQLKDYDARYYAAAASCIHDMIVAGWSDSDIIGNQEIKNTAIAALKAANGCGWAEKILALMPWDVPFEVCETNAFCNAYKTRLEAELSSAKHEACPEVTFGVLAAHDYWKGKPWEMRLEFERVECYYNKHGHLIDKGQAKRLRLLRCEAKKQ